MSKTWSGALNYRLYVNDRIGIGCGSLELPEPSDETGCVKPLLKSGKARKDLNNSKRKHIEWIR